MSIAAAAKTLTISLIGNPNTGKSTLFGALAGVRQRTGNYPGVTVEKKVGRTEFHGQKFTIIDLPGTYSLAPRSPDEMVAVDVLLGRMADVPKPDVVLCIVDASNLERNFYLLSQVLELGLPTVVAVNMVDVAEDKGLVLDLEKLAAQLPVTFVPVQANRRVGLAQLKQALAEAAESTPKQVPSPFPEKFAVEVENLVALANANGRPALPRYLVERLLLDTSGYLASGLPGIGPPLLDEVQAARRRLSDEGLPVPGVEAMARYQWAGEVLSGVVSRPAERRQTLSDRIDRVLTHRVWGTLVFLVVMMLMFQAVFYVAEPASWLIDGLNGWLGGIVTQHVPEGALQSLLVTGVIGGVGGVLVFLPQIFTLFFFIALLEDCGYMARAAYLMDKLMSRVGLSGKSFIPLLSSFACAVPGIMATRVIENRRDRFVTILVAPLMSCSARLPVYALLIGAFVPNVLLLGWTWERGDSAYSVGLGLQGVTMFAMYSVGIVAGIAVAWVLKTTLFRGPTPPFVMELPSYKLPGLGIVLHRMFEQGWAFIYRAGTVILAVAIIVWALGYYPRNEQAIDAALLARQAALEDEIALLHSRDQRSRSGPNAGNDDDSMQNRDPASRSGPDAGSGDSLMHSRDQWSRSTALRANESAPPDSQRPQSADQNTIDNDSANSTPRPMVAGMHGDLPALEEELAAVNNQIAGAHLENSFLGRMGKWVEPVVRPLGWDWRLGCAAIASFPAREVVVATLGVIYNLGEEAEDDPDTLAEALQNATWQGTDRKVFSLPVALSVMVFFALCAQCASTLAIMRRETGSWRWPVLAFVYMTTLAYVGALITYQVGIRLMG